MKIVSQLLTLLGIVAAALFVSGLRPVFLIPAYGALSVAALVAWLPRGRIDLSPRVIPCLVATLLFFLYVLLRTTFSPVDYIARPDLFMVLGALIVYFVTVLCATSPASRLVFTCIFLALSCAHVLVGAIQFSKGNDFMPFDFLPRSSYLSRASGFYGCPNHLAGFLEITMLMALSLAFWSRWRLLGKIVAGYLALVCAAGLLMTGSRGGYASAAIGLFVFAVISLALARHWMWREIWLFLITVLVIVAIGGGYVVYATLHKSDYLSMRIGSAGGDAPLRLALWKAALKQFELSPILGTGSGTYLYYGRLFRAPVVLQDPVYAHSDVLQFLAEFGLLGIAGLAAFLFLHLRSGWKFLADIIARRTVEGERDAPGFHGDNSLALTVGALCGIVALLAHSLGDFNLHIPPNTLAMAFLFGTLANPFSVLVPEAKAVSPRAKMFLRGIPFVLPLLGVWLAVVAFPKWPAEQLADKSKVLLSDWHSLQDPAVASNAADLARQSLDRDPKNPEMYLALGDSFVSLAEMEDDPAAQAGPYAKAVDAYRRGILVAPLDSHLIVALARTYDALKRFDEAGPLFRRAVELDGNAAEIHWEYGNHFHAQGDLENAEIQYQKAHELANGVYTYQFLENVRKERKALAEPKAL